jgi:hypothetical protein
MKEYDEELLAASGGNLEQYHADIKNLGDRLKQEVERLKNTAAGRKRLAAAGFNVPKADGKTDNQKLSSRIANGAARGKKK